MGRTARFRTRRQLLRAAIGLAGAVLVPGCQLPRFPWQPVKVHRIAYLGGMLAAERLRVFEDGLRELGYLEGQHYRLARMEEDAKRDWATGRRASEKGPN
jgi:hypothetical protein